MFEKSTHHYTDSVGGILRSTGRYLVLYLIIVVGMAYLVLIWQEGAWQTHEQIGHADHDDQIQHQVTHYYLTKEKNNVESVFAVNGFGFAGRGQNTGIALPH